jgi:hypothetical protein
MIVTQHPAEEGQDAHLVHGLDADADADADAILNRSMDPVRKGSNKSIPLVVFNNLCSVFSHESQDINIDDLPCFITVLLIPPAFWQRASIDF